ncbi:uncharacterized protein LOC108666143 [Hyalella azteca]|uniref:Uncharacterized protein LOC108666143 n=1 Tax=Hyalella azteca TaxID=294128 RepID=A0A8B7N4E4_HYAAZ|nr:uncharacterized protein LOC108666143 [Hyalella azteca]
MATSVSIGGVGSLLALGTIAPATIAGVTALLGIGALLHGSHHRAPSYGYKSAGHMHRNVKPKGGGGGYDKHFEESSHNKGPVINNHGTTGEGTQHHHSYMPTNQHGSHHSSMRFEVHADEHKPGQDFPVYSSVQNAVSESYDGKNSIVPTGFGQPKAKTLHSIMGNKGIDHNSKHSMTAGMSKFLFSSSFRTPPPMETNGNRFDAPNIRSKQKEIADFDDGMRSHFREFQESSREPRHVQNRRVDNGLTETFAEALLDIALARDSSDCGKRMICEIAGIPRARRTGDQQALLSLLGTKHESYHQPRSAALQQFSEARDIGSNQWRLCHVRYPLCPIRNGTTVLQALEIN